MLSPEELTQFEALAKKFEPAQLPDIKKVVQTHMHAVFQDINDGGRAAANSQSKARIVELEETSTTAKAAADAAAKELKELREKNPDAAAQIRAAEEKVERLKEKHKAEKDEPKQQVQAERQSRANGDLVRELVASGIDPEYAGAVLAQRTDVKERVRVKEDGSVEVLQAGNKELTITPAEGRSALSHLAEELVAKVDDKWKVSNINRGPAFDGLPKGGAGNKFDQIRESVKAAEKAGVRTGTEGHDRLRGVRPAPAAAK